MGAIASQITSLTIVYSIRLFEHRSKKTSKFRVTGLYEGNSPVIGGSPHKGPVTRKMFPFDDVIMIPQEIMHVITNPCPGDERY